MTSFVFEMMAKSADISKRKEGSGLSIRLNSHLSNTCALVNSAMAQSGVSARRVPVSTRHVRTGAPEHEAKSSVLRLREYLLSVDSAKNGGKGLFMLVTCIAESFTGTSNCMIWYTLNISLLGAMGKNTLIKMDPM